MVVAGVRPCLRLVGAHVRGEAERLGVLGQGRVDLGFAPAEPRYDVLFRQFEALPVFDLSVRPASRHR